MIIIITVIIIIIITIIETGTMKIIEKWGSGRELDCSRKLRYWERILSKVIDF